MSKTTYHLDVIEPDGDKKRIDFGASGTALVSNGPSALPSFSAPSAFVEEIEDDTEFFNVGDTTKRFVLSAAGISTGTTRTLTVPDSSGTLALTSDLSGGVFLDSDFTLQQNGDVTAQAQFAVNSATATTRTFQLPDADDTLALLAAIQTLTNKTINDATNDVGANRLRNSSTAVNIGSSGAPGTNYILQASNSTTASWIQGSGSGSMTVSNTTGWGAGPPTGATGFWCRVGDVVTVSGRVTGATIPSSTDLTFQLTTFHGSSFGVATARGTASSVINAFPGRTDVGWVVEEVTGTNRVRFNGRPIHWGGAATLSFTFQYRV